MRTVRALGAGMALLLLGGVAWADEDFLPRTAVVPADPLWTVESPTNLSGQANAFENGAGFCCAVTGAEPCTLQGAFQVGDIVYFNSYFNDISNGGLIQYRFTLALRSGTNVIVLFDEPVVFDTSAIPAGQPFLGCTGAPWQVVPQASGRSGEWGSRYIGNGGVVQGIHGTVRAY